MASEGAAKSADVRQPVAAKAQDTHPVGEWRTALMKALALPSDPYAAWRFAVASKIHGWSECEHHTGKPFECTREDFEAAIKAAGGPDYTPHKPALFTLSTRSAD